MPALIIRAVPANRGRSIAIRVDAGIKLVQHVRIVRSISVLSSAGAAGGMRARSSHDATGSSTVAVASAIKVGVNAGIDLVGKIAVVGTGIGAVGEAAMGASVTGDVIASVRTGLGGIIGSGVSTGMVSPRSVGQTTMGWVCAVITVRVDARISGIAKATCVRTMRSLSSLIGTTSGVASGVGGGWFLVTNMKLVLDLVHGGLVGSVVGGRHDEG